MTKFYEMEITETRVTTTRCLVEARDGLEAECKALAGEFVLEGRPASEDVSVDRRATVEGRNIARGSSLQRIRNALAKPYAFTVHARLWTAQGLGPEREYAVMSVGHLGRVEGITMSPFPEGEQRFVPADDIFGLRIESESDDVSYAVSGIRYDTDGETAIVDLPEDLEIDLPADTDRDDVEELLGEAISERTGWCHKGFDYELAA